MKKSNKIKRTSKHPYIKVRILEQLHLNDRSVANLLKRLKYAINKAFGK